MARVKQMVKRSQVETAKAKRTCKFTNENIPKGTNCLVVYEGPRERFCYSITIGIEMIQSARGRLDELERELRSHAVFADRI